MWEEPRCDLGYAQPALGLHKIPFHFRLLLDVLRNSTMAYFTRIIQCNFGGVQGDQTPERQL